MILSFDDILSQPMTHPNWSANSWILSSLTCLPNCSHLSFCKRSSIPCHRFIRVEMCCRMHDRFETCSFVRLVWCLMRCLAFAQTRHAFLRADLSALALDTTLQSRASNLVITLLSNPDSITLWANLGAGTVLAYDCLVTQDLAKIWKSSPSSQFSSKRSACSIDILKKISKMTVCELKWKPH